MMYNIFDGHCDTMYELSGKPEENIVINRLQFNLVNTEIYQKYIQVLALWADPSYKDKETRIYMENLLRRTIRHLEEYEINIIKSKADLENTSKFSAIIGIEGADDIDSPERLLFYYNKGVRCITLTWNGKNLIAGGIDTNDSLSFFGREIIKNMNELGMIIDVSHLNEKSFSDVVSFSDTPVIASHSNSKAICNHKRNITDEQFNLLKSKGGVCGINFSSSHLDDNGNADISTVVAHIEHFCSLGGEFNVGLGSDFDGGINLPAGIASNKDTYLILNELLKLNYTEEQVKNVGFNNFYNVFYEILG